MKKVLLVAAFIAVSSLSFAQVSFGPKLGLGISSFKNTKSSSGTTTSYSSVITPQVGAVLNVQLGDYFALRPELLYLQRGAKTEKNGFTTVYRLSYVELPINVAAGLEAGPGRFEFFAGPSFGFCLGGNGKTTGNGADVKTTYKTSKVPTTGFPANTSYINFLNVSLNLGLDYKFNNGLLVQVGYNLGFSNLSPHYSDSNLESKRSENVIKASSVNIGVAYLFGGK